MTKPVWQMNEEELRQELKTWDQNAWNKFKESYYQAVNIQFDMKKPETVYVERRVPIELEDKTHNLIDQFLKANGYDPEEI
jgi:hypothetical protein